MDKVTRYQTDLFDQPELLPHGDVLGRGIDMSAHVPCCGQFLRVVPAAIDHDQGGEDGGEEGRLEDSPTELPVLLRFQGRLAGDEDPLQCL